jgi:hypothetical protein
VERLADPERSIAELAGLEFVEKLVTTASTLASYAV